MALGSSWPLATPTPPDDTEMTERPGSRCHHEGQTIDLVKYRPRAAIPDYSILKIWA